jgi:hypothetical protein
LLALRHSPKLLQDAKKAQNELRRGMIPEMTMMEAKEEVIDHSIKTKNFRLNMYCLKEDFFFTN